MRSTTAAFAFVLVALAGALVACSSTSTTPAAPMQAQSLSTVAGTQAEPFPHFTSFAVPLLSNFVPPAIALGPDRALWFDEETGTTSTPLPRIGRITLRGSATSFSRGASGVGSISQIIAGPGPNISFAAYQPGVGQMSTVGRARFFLPADGSSSSLGLTIAADGAVWFTEQGVTNIGRLGELGHVTEYPIGAAFAGTAGSIAAGPDRAVWFTSIIGLGMGRMTLDGKAAPIKLPAQVVDPTGIMQGPDGAMWFSDISANLIGRISPVTRKVTLYPSAPIGVPFGLIAGPDGALWFIGVDRTTLGRMTVSGHVTTFAVPPARPGANVIVGGLAAGPDDAIWFTEAGGPRICRLNVR